MPKMLRCVFVLVVSLLIFVKTGACVSGVGPAEPLVSQDLLEHAGLQTVWVTKLPLKANEHLGRLFIIGDSLYALSNQNYIVSLNREKGSSLFSRGFAPAGFTVLDVKSYEDKLISVAGSKLVEIDPVSGRELSSNSLGLGVTCPVVRNKGHFYIAGADSRLRAFRAEDHVKLFEVAAENESLITSVIADDNYVIFGTVAGNVICITPNGPRRRWQFDAAAGILQPIVRDGESLFAASKDTHVYKLDVTRGTPPVWKYQTAAILDRGPRVTAQVVYQYVNEKGVTDIDKNSGRFMWEVHKGVDLLAEALGRAYVITHEGEFVVMDNRSMKRLYSANFAAVSKYAPNTVDSKIYLGDQSGRIVCLRPVK